MVVVNTLLLVRVQLILFLIHLMVLLGQLLVEVLPFSQQVVVMLLIVLNYLDLLLLEVEQILLFIVMTVLLGIQ